MLLLIHLGTSCILIRPYLRNASHLYVHALNCNCTAYRVLSVVNKLSYLAHHDIIFGNWEHSIQHYFMDFPIRKLWWFNEIVLTYGIINFPRNATGKSKSSGLSFRIYYIEEKVIPNVNMQTLRRYRWTVGLYLWGDLLLWLYNSHIPGHVHLASKARKWITFGIIK